MPAGAGAPARLAAYPRYWTLVGGAGGGEKSARAREREQNLFKIDHTTLLRHSLDDATRQEMMNEPLLSTLSLNCR